MLRIKIVTVGKHKEKWLSEAIEEYTERLKNEMEIEWVLAKDTKALEKLLEKEPKIYVLDPNGSLMSSEKFSAWLLAEFPLNKLRMTFVIGDAFGIPFSILERATKKISLSPMTLTHQICRVVFLEQLYRALEIKKGSSYHK